MLIGRRVTDSKLSSGLLISRTYYSVCNPLIRNQYRAQMENTSLNQTLMEYKLYLSQIRSPKENVLHKKEEGMGFTNTDYYRRKWKIILG